MGLNLKDDIIQDEHIDQFRKLEIAPEPFSGN
jgi:hypothetical protein